MPVTPGDDVRLTPILIVGLAAMALAAVLYPFGWFVPVSYPDTLSYEETLRQPNVWGFLRHPLYGWILQAADSTGLGRNSFPALHLGALALAAMALSAAARMAGADRSAAVALGLAAVLGQAVVIWGNALLPEAFATALILLALALVLVATRGGLFWPAAVLLSPVVTIAVILRPILLPALAVLPALYLVLAAKQRQGWQIGRCLGLIALLVVPLVLHSAQRYREVGDFNIVSFGGVGSLGMTAQLLTPEILPRLPEAHRATATDVLAAKQRAVDAQTAMPLFRNSAGESLFRTTALDGFDTLARNFDEIVWGQIYKLQKPDESWVAFNARMGGLSAAIIRTVPDRYAMWVMGATSRLVGRLLTYNVAFVLACIAFVAMALWNTVNRGQALGGGSGGSWTLLGLIVGSWVICTSGLTVIAAFPALRYTDTGGLLLTALPLYGVFLAVAKTKSADPA